MTLTWVLSQTETFVLEPCPVNLWQFEVPLFLNVADIWWGILYVTHRSTGCLNYWINITHFDCHVHCLSSLSYNKEKIYCTHWVWHCQLSIICTRWARDGNWVNVKRNSRSLVASQLVYLKNVICTHWVRDSDWVNVKRNSRSSVAFFKGSNL